MTERDIYGTCAHCGGNIVVASADIACKIFRHATYRADGQPIPAHATKNECDKLVAAGLIWGCGGPLRLTDSTIGDNTSYLFIPCDYL